MVRNFHVIDDLADGLDDVFRLRQGFGLGTHHGYSPLARFDGACRADQKIESGGHDVSLRCHCAGLNL
jgi:hypothetical protein